MSDDRRGDVSQETVRAVLDAIRKEAPERMPVPRNDEFGEAFERRITRRGSDRDVYEFPPHLRDWFDGLDRDDVENIKRVAKLGPDAQKWLSGKSDEQLKVFDQMARDYEGARLIGRFLWKAIAALGVIFAGFWAFGQKAGEVLAYFKIGRLP